MKQEQIVTDISQGTAEELLRRAGLPAPDGVRCRRIKSGNRVFELSTEANVFFLKSPAKDFVDSIEPAVQAGARVVQEWAAWECLKRHDLPFVEVVAVEPQADNPIGWPYILTRGLGGRPLLGLLQEPEDSAWPAAIWATGAYLSAAHSITFDRVGHILSPEGPAPDPAGRRPYTVHDPGEEQAAAFKDLSRARPYLEEELANELAERFHHIAESIASEYEPPRFVHASFHLNHPYVDASGGLPRVIGCVDMESASSGAVFDDLTTVAAGMMVDTQRLLWWEPFFEGYGSAPDFERFRLALLATCFYCFGEETAKQDVQSTYRALLAAESWEELFNANRSLV